MSNVSPFSPYVQRIKNDVLLWNFYFFLLSFTCMEHVMYYINILSIYNVFKNLFLAENKPGGLRVLLIHSSLYQISVNVLIFKF